MFSKAKKNFDDRISVANDWPSFLSSLNKGNMVLTPWCMEEEEEKKVKEKSGLESKL